MDAVSNWTLMAAIPQATRNFQSYCLEESEPVHCFQPNIYKYNTMVWCTSSFDRRTSLVWHQKKRIVIYDIFMTKQFFSKIWRPDALSFPLQPHCAILPQDSIFHRRCTILVAAFSPYIHNSANYIKRILLYKIYLNRKVMSSVSISEWNKLLCILRITLMGFFRRPSVKIFYLCYTEQQHTSESYVVLLLSRVLIWCSFFS